MKLHRLNMPVTTNTISKLT